MRLFRRRLTVLIRLENTHCGHADEVAKAVAARLALEAWLEAELNALETPKNN